MEKDKMAQFKTLFLELKKKASTPAHEEEAQETSLEWRLKGRENLYNQKINQALLRLHNGSFGECEECGESISLERLKARPTATLCIHCKDLEEKDEGQIPYQKRSHSLGRTLAVVSPNVVGLIDQEGDTLEKINGASVLEFVRARQSE